MVTVLARASISKFIAKSAVLNKTSYVSSDDPFLLLAVVPTSEFQRIRELNGSDLNPSSFVATVTIGFNRAQLIQLFQPLLSGHNLSERNRTRQSTTDAYPRNAHRQSIRQSEFHYVAAFALTNDLDR